MNTKEIGKKSFKIVCQLLQRDYNILENAKSKLLLDPDLEHFEHQVYGLGDNPRDAYDMAQSMLKHITMFRFLPAMIKGINRQRKTPEGMVYMVAICYTVPDLSNVKKCTYRERLVKREARKKEQFIIPEDTNEKAE